MHQPGRDRCGPDGRLVSVFGDTFEDAGVGGPGWRSPVVLFGDSATAHTGIVWTGAAGPGDYAHQVLAYEHGSAIDGRTVTTVLPIDIITIGDQMYLHAMVCGGLGTVHWTGYLVPSSTLNDLHLIVSQWNTATNWPYQAMQFHANVTN